ncbi:MAG: hypothetical protein RLZZ58_579 [Pseudomonadota bacterium]
MNLLAFQRDLRTRIVGDGDTSSPGLAIYRGAYRARLIEALKSGFDKTWSWIGDDAFVTAATHHIILHPPSSWTLDAYGGGFPATLAALFADDPEVTELAWLEWHMQQAFGAPDGPVVDAAGLTAAITAAPDWAAARFGLVESLAMRVAATNATAIWHALADDREPPGAAPLDAPSALIVWRRGFAPHFRIIDAAEHAALQLVEAGAGFGDLCDGLRGDADDAATVAMIGTWLGQWVHDGLIARIDG